MVERCGILVGLTYLTLTKYLEALIFSACHRYCELMPDPIENSTPATNFELPWGLKAAAVLGIAVPIGMMAHLGFQEREQLGATVTELGATVTELGQQAQAVMEAGSSSDSSVPR